MKIHYADRRTQQGSTIPNWASGSQNSPWRYGGPNGTNSGGPDTVEPGGTIEEVEEGGTAPAPTTAPVPAPALAAIPATQPLPTTAVVPVPVPTAAVDSDPYDQYHQQQTNHYHLHGDERSDRRRSRHTHSRHHGRRRCHRGDDENNDGILGLVERERRRDSERQMADADASHRREAMMMELVDRARSADRDRSRGGGGAGLDARDILGVLLDDVAERRGRPGDAAREKGSGGDDALKGALDALSRRVDEMVLSGREKEKDRVAAPASPARRTPRNRASRVKFTQDGSGPVANSNKNAGGLSGGKKRGIVGGIKFSRRGRDSLQDDEGGADTDTDDTSGPSLVRSGRGVRARGRSLRRAGSQSTSAD